MPPPPILPLCLLTQLMCISGTSFLSQKNNEKIPSEGFDEAHISQTNPERTIIFMIRLFFLAFISEFYTKTFLSSTFNPTRSFSRSDVRNRLSEYQKTPINSTSQNAYCQMNKSIMTTKEGVHLTWISQWRFIIICTMYNVHLMLIMDMRGKDLLVTTNSHMASLIEVPLAVRSPRLTCNEKRLLIRNFTNFLSIVCSTTTVGKIVVQHLVNTWYCETAMVVQRLTTSRSSEEGDVITIVVQVHGVPASVHLLHRTTWVAPREWEAWELFLSLHQLTSLPRAHLPYCFRAPAIFSSPQGPHWIISGSSCTSRTLVISDN